LACEGNVDCGGGDVGVAKDAAQGFLCLWFDFDKWADTLFWKIFRNKSYFFSF